MLRPLVRTPIGLVGGVSVLLLQLAYEAILLTPDFFKLVVAELAPLFPRVAFELFPLALDDVPVHLRLPLATDSNFTLPHHCGRCQPPWRLTPSTVMWEGKVGVRSERETQMDWNIIEGKWKELKGHAREQWGKLSDDELEEIGGKKDRLVGKLQQKYGYAADEANRRADEWAKHQDEATKT